MHLVGGVVVFEANFKTLSGDFKQRLLMEIDVLEIGTCRVEERQSGDSSRKIRVMEKSWRSQGLV